VIPRLNNDFDLITFSLRFTFAKLQIVMHRAVKTKLYRNDLAESVLSICNVCTLTLRYRAMTRFDSKFKFKKCH
jgi:hypothetical protein